MNTKIQKLELTWVGKDNRPRLEPRVLVEDAAKSHHAATRRRDGKDIFDNMLIHGDNLLALKALEQEYAGKVKCIYIDPPYNTGSAFEHYDDGLEHSIWLGLMKSRLEILHHLLSEDGAIFVHLDDNESDYCKVLLDEIFDRKNFMNRITIAARSPSAFSVVNPGLFVAAESILYYAKNRSRYTEHHLRVERSVDYAYDKWIVDFDKPCAEWKFLPLPLAYMQERSGIINETSPISAIKNYNKFIIRNAKRICRFTAISDTGAGQRVLDAKKKSLEDPLKIVKVDREGLDSIYIVGGQQISFYSKNIAMLQGRMVPTTKATDIWTDIAWEGIATEGGVKFKKSKKPERLIERVLTLATNPGDLVLDSFLGSGTTAAVAHKMGRRWIGVELGDHCYTHCKVRLDKVIDGEDPGGITKAVGWKGGGGYRFYELAPTFITKDQWGQEVINRDYNPAMLAEAVCKLEGYVYSPSQDEYFIHGHATEKAFIYVTTNFMRKKNLAAISERLGEGRHLLICCKAFDKAAAGEFDNLTVRKIPDAVLNKCEWGHDDYSLNVANLPMAKEAAKIEQMELL